ncbi:MAG: hypothetical protein IPK19_25205 [Chloroflexi bacterium]|nr:hypothetical protein [Chloroflexota bacterium]
MRLLILVLLCLATIGLEATPDQPDFSWTKRLSEAANGVEWSPDGHSIVFYNEDDRQIAMLDWKTGAVAWRTPFPASGFAPGAFLARWSPDGHWIAATYAGKLYLIDPQTGHFELREVSAPPGRTAPVFYILPRWDADSTSLAVLDVQGFIDVLTLPTGEITQSLEMSGGIEYQSQYVAFDLSPDGQFFVGFAWSYRTTGVSVVFWDRGGNVLGTYTRESETDPIPGTPCLGNAEDVISLEWANDSRTLVAAGTFGYSVCRLNSDGTVYHRFIADNGASIFRWSPDQRWFVGAASAGQVFWITDTANDYQTTEEQIDPDSAQITSFAWSPDSQHLAIGTRSELWIGTLELRQ